jgi:monofunctional biosynthetic peptidoglycan transglycosylase
MHRLTVLFIVGMVPAALAAQGRNMRVIVDFEDPGSVPWTIVNDGVMGGRSSSAIELTERGTVMFKGNVSLENNGGFASTRALLPATDLSSYDGVTVRVRGDGRRYQLRFRVDGRFDGIAYMAEFDTEPGEWMELSVPFSDFQPTVRGYRPPGAGPLDTQRLRQVGFLIGDQKEGPFELEIAWIKAHRPGA